MKTKNALTEGQRIKAQKKLHALPPETWFTVSGHGIVGQPTVYRTVPVFATIDESLAGATKSLCGVKGHIFFHDLQIESPRRRTTTTTEATALGFLSMTDAPPHWHGKTNELYYIWEGAGLMVLGRNNNQRFDVVPVKPGDYVYLPAGVIHGLWSEKGVKAILSFNPGLIRRDAVEKVRPFRDEEVAGLYCREWIDAIQNNSPVSWATQNRPVIDETAFYGVDPQHLESGEAIVVADETTIYERVPLLGGPAMVPIKMESLPIVTVRTHKPNPVSVQFTTPATGIHIALDGSGKVFFAINESYQAGRGSTWLVPGGSPHVIISQPEMKILSVYATGTVVP